MKIIKRSKEEFNQIFSMVTIKDWNKPMTYGSGIEPDGALENPYGQMCCVVL